MPYAIAKRTYDGISARYVTAIRQGGYRMDCVRIEDDQLVKLAHLSVHMRIWPTEAKATAALAKLASVGGYDDYAVVALASAA
jgi:hypothetical protein